LKDITLRALEILKMVDFIACEDTRHTKILLDHYGISNKSLISFYSYNQDRKISDILSRLSSGKNIALVSDGGTPGISDPGTKLVKRDLENNMIVESIPGPTALITALVCSGLPTDGFVFLGFLPRKQGKIRKLLLSSLSIGKTVIFYESPHRIERTLRLCNDFLGSEIDCEIARELTKRFEEYIRGKLDDVYKKISSQSLKGEIVVLLHSSLQK